MSKTVRFIRYIFIRQSHHSKSFRRKVLGLTEMKEQIMRIRFNISLQAKKVLHQHGKTKNVTLSFEQGPEKHAGEERLQPSPESQKCFDEEFLDIEPNLNPQQTILCGGGYYRKSCNFLTANKFRSYIRKTYFWASKRGIDVYITDVATPFGLLALETLLSLRNEGEHFQLYSVRSKLFVKRKTYRLIRETPVEMALLESKCDYCYQFLDPSEMVHKILSKSGLWCNTRGIRIAQKDPNWMQKIVGE